VFQHESARCFFWRLGRTIAHFFSLASSKKTIRKFVFRTLPFGPFTLAGSRLMAIMVMKEWLCSYVLAGKSEVKSMKSVNIAELKNRLSVYLNDVKAGEEILVRDRNQPVARIVPLARSRDEDEELLGLASQGKLRLGHGVIDESFWAMPAPRVSAAELRRAVEQERDED
jgi:prevent-host-death family protein